MADGAAKCSGVRGIRWEAGRGPFNSWGGRRASFDEIRVTRGGRVSGHNRFANVSTTTTVGIDRNVQPRSSHPARCSPNTGVRIALGKPCTSHRRACQVRLVGCKPSRAWLADVIGSFCVRRRHEHSRRLPARSWQFLLPTIPESGGSASSTVASHRGGMRTRARRPESPPRSRALAKRKGRHAGCRCRIRRTALCGAHTTPRGRQQLGRARAPRVLPMAKGP